MIDEERVFTDVEQELVRARGLFPDFPTAMHGISVIREEFEELWEQIRRKDGDRDHRHMYEEACQVAAMAIRFMLDCCPDADRDEELLDHLEKIWPSDDDD